MSQGFYVWSIGKHKGCVYPTKQKTAKNIKIQVIQEESFPLCLLKSFNANLFFCIFACQFSASGGQGSWAQSKASSEALLQQWRDEKGELLEASPGDPLEGAIMVNRLIIMDYSAPDGRPYEYSLLCTLLSTVFIYVLLHDLAGFMIVSLAMRSDRLVVCAGPKGFLKLFKVVVSRAERVSMSTQAAEIENWKQHVCLCTPEIRTGLHRAIACYSNETIIRYRKAIYQAM